MNDILTNQISEGISFTEDAYILNDLFFIPKNYPVQDYHLKLLRNWNIDKILTNGSFTSPNITKITKEKTDRSSQIDEALGITKENINKNEIVMKNERSEEKSDEDTPIDLNSRMLLKTNALLDSGIRDFYELYKKWIKFEIQIFGSMLTNRKADKEWVKRLILEIIGNVNKNRNNALMLFGKKIEGIIYVYSQTLESVILAYIIGDSMKLSQLELSNLSIATLFHDIGMLKIPKEILNKKEPLNRQEMALIKAHTTIGYKLLRDVKYSAVIASGALQHQERIDGKGYPNGLTGDKITSIAKIISVVDAYCAAISSKPFKESPLHAKEVIQDLLRGGGTAYDSNILKELIKNISFYPIGSLILLSNDKPARVVGTSGVAMKPIIKILEANRDGPVIDLSKDSNIYIKGLYTKKEEYNL